ncbi:band 7 protein [Candidatus Dojkabacteria bacterium CG_4_9_14_3_um_filter_150_Dojkabacteria_WS6_41_13]|uniref:Band 7 protein n=1 Tax=Candidatus Dojkabacteria bacterium CG_4_10_14_0_2_um_filter_Dojkabacteria_WS6_41_15 TaxID=2014249 RepID=A0A2M7W2N2_9BACT|nr:MAG: band 7 protein [Candidatus Dojkabacteria bacterium CG_4_10_14_3_um_filter_Dojkabacteria_WS6_41_9]PJA15066.1 MAG: band 7 protein [Candidatus Dojkabacteria bacterium CG_4_10_14_0_2_um_filter_Dojkabacteria_WS6_41_15]PJB22808.1 MAG: band 7 protein [Candidatus Dojkabacteria bacterium CG_4_9_14_3_um_filter_150_Dojkabacteria_WS6_41_13]
MPVVLIAVVSLFVVAPLFLVIIDTGKIGVISTFGKVSVRVLYSGLNIKSPFSQVTKISVRTEESTMSSVENEGRMQGDDSVEARASDGAQVKVDITVLFHVKPDAAMTIFKELGVDYEAKIIRPVIRSAIREVIAKYTVTEVFSTKRDEIAQKIKEQVASDVEPRGVVVEDTSFRDVKLCEALAASIEQKLTAQQESEKYEFILAREKKEADRKVIEAKGQRDAQILISQSLTPKYLSYLYIISLKDRQGTIYVPTEGGMPLFKQVQ